MVSNHGLAKRETAFDKSYIYRKSKYIIVLAGRQPKPGTSASSSSFVMLSCVKIHD